MSLSSWCVSYLPDYTSNELEISGFLASGVHTVSHDKCVIITTTVFTKCNAHFCDPNLPNKNVKDDTDLRHRILGLAVNFHCDVIVFFDALSPQTWPGFRR